MVSSAVWLYHMIRGCAGSVWGYGLSHTHTHTNTYTHTYTYTHTHTHTHTYIIFQISCIITATFYKADD